MKNTLFLYNFAKVFIPGAIILCIIFGFSNHIPKVIQKSMGPSQAIIPQRKISLPKQLPFVRQERVRKPVAPKSNPVKPNSYVFIVDFKSGGTMKAKGLSIKNNIVTLRIDDGYTVKMSKNDIQKIRKMKL